MPKQQTKWQAFPDVPVPTGLPDELGQCGGVCPMTATLGDQPEEEVVVAIVEPDDAGLAGLVSLEPFQMRVYAALIPTDHGPVLSLLWTIEDPAGGSEPYFIQELSLDPNDPTFVELYVRLANQTHCHVAIVDRHLDVRRWIEFDGVFGLDEDLPRLLAGAVALPTRDFAAAKAEVEARYSVLQLLAMHGREAPAAGDALQGLAELLQQCVLADAADDARAVGEHIDANGGVAAMAAVHRAYSARYPHPQGNPRLLEVWWNHIGSWQS